VQENPITEIAHNSPPASIAPREAEQCQRALWEASIEANSRQMAPGDISDESSDFYILPFGRHPKQFDDAIKASQLAADVIASGGEVQPSWANGAKILAPGITEEVWRDAGLGIELKPYHVLVGVERMDDFNNVLMSLRYRDRPRPKPDGPRAHVSMASLMNDVSSSCSSSDAIYSDETIFGDGTVSGSGIKSMHVWLDSVRDAVKDGHRIRLNVSRTFFTTEEEPPITPRSRVTESAPEQGGARSISNPRIWHRS